MNTILDEAESRAVNVAQAARAQEAQIVTEMRKEIGVAHYDRAKQQAPILGRAIDKIHRPFVQHIATLEAKSGTPFPGLIRGYLTQLSEQCVGAPAQLRAGIHAYESLSVRSMLLKDGSVDVVVRAGLIAQICAQLNSHDGRLSAMDNLKTIIEQWIVESGWPASVRPASLPLTAPRYHADEMTVESTVEL